MPQEEYFDGTGTQIEPGNFYKSSGNNDWLGYVGTDNSGELVLEIKGIYKVRRMKLRRFPKKDLKLFRRISNPRAFLRDRARQVSFIAERLENVVVDSKAE